MTDRVDTVAEVARSLEPGLLYQLLDEGRFPIRPLARWPELQWHLLGADLSVGREVPPSRGPSRLRVRNAVSEVLERGLWVTVLDGRVRFVRESDESPANRLADEDKLSSITLVAAEGSELLARWLARQEADRFQEAYANSIGRLTGKKSGFPVLLHVGPGETCSIEPDRYLMDVVMGFDRAG